MKVFSLLVSYLFAASVVAEPNLRGGVEEFDEDIELDTLEATQGHRHLTWAERIIEDTPDMVRATCAQMIPFHIFKNKPL